jgi:hypothetical protein
VGGDGGVGERGVRRIVLYISLLCLQLPSSPALSSSSSVNKSKEGRICQGGLELGTYQSDRNDLLSSSSPSPRSNSDEEVIEPVKSVRGVIEQQ